MIVDSLLQQIETGRSGHSQGITMGLPKLEGIIDGVTRQTYTVIFSLTSGGKTSLAIYSYVYRPCMEHLQDEDFHVIYYSLEISGELLMAKLLSIYIFEHYKIELSAKDILSRTKGAVLSDEYYNIIKECIPWLRRIEQMVTIYDGALNANTFYSTMINELKKVGQFIEEDGKKKYIPNNPERITAVVIDHLNLLTQSAGRTIKQEIDLLSTELVSLRNSCGISPVAIMQANRNSMSPDRHKLGMGTLNLSDLKDSSGPSQDAEIVIGIYNPFRDKIANYRGYDIKQIQDNCREILTIKNRYGESEVSDFVSFYGKVGIFAELPAPDKIYDYSKYQSPLWILDPKIEEDKKPQTFNFTL